MFKVFVSFCFALSAAFMLLSAQTANRTSIEPLPLVEQSAIPYYPPIAKAARQQGIVHLSVTTDGHKVIATHVEDGLKLLSDAADKNVRSWEFADHAPMTLVVTFRYRLVEDSKGDRNDTTVILRLPTEVEVLSKPLPPLDASHAHTK